MSEFVKDSETTMDLQKKTVAKIRELQTRWSELLAWATKRTVYLNTVIANWQEFRQREIVATEFIDGREKDLEGSKEEAKPDSDEVTKERVDQLENMQAEARENSLDIWKLQRQSDLLIKSIGEDTAASKNIKQQTNDLTERNDKLSEDISVGINNVRSTWVLPR